MQGEQRFHLRLGHLAQMFERSDLVRGRVMKHKHHASLVGPLLLFPFENLSQMSGRDVLDFVVLIDDNRHMVGKTGGQREHYPRTQTENPWIFHTLSLLSRP